MDEQINLPTEAVLAIVEELGAAVMMASGDDDDELAGIRTMVERLGAAEDPRARQASTQVLALFDVAHDVAARPAALGEVATMASELQRRLQEPAPPATSASGSTPPPVAERDAETVERLGDFLQEAEEGLDTVEGILMALEADGDEGRPLRGCGTCARGLRVPLRGRSGGGRRPPGARAVCSPRRSLSAPPSRAP